MGLKRKKSGSISRVLYPVTRDRRRPFILTNCYQLALPIHQEATYPLLLLGPSNSLLGLAGGGVCPASTVTGAAVRSYRAISPLPVSALGGPSAVYFLWHFPAGYRGPILQLIAKWAPAPGGR